MQFVVFCWWGEIKPVRACIRWFDWYGCFEGVCFKSNKSQAQVRSLPEVQGPVTHLWMRVRRYLIDTLSFKNLPFVYSALGLNEIACQVPVVTASKLSLVSCPARKYSWKAHFNIGTLDPSICHRDPSICHLSHSLQQPSIRAATLRHTNDHEFP